MFKSSKANEKCEPVRTVSSTDLRYATHGIVASVHSPEARGIDRVRPRAVQEDSQLQLDQIQGRLSLFETRMMGMVTDNDQDIANLQQKHRDLQQDLRDIELTPGQRASVVRAAPQAHPVLMAKMVLTARREPRARKVQRVKGADATTPAPTNADTGANHAPTQVPTKAPTPAPCRTTPTITVSLGARPTARQVPRWPLR